MEDGAAVLGPPTRRGCSSKKVVQTPDITEQERHKSEIKRPIESTAVLWEDILSYKYILFFV